MRYTQFQKRSLLFILITMVFCLLSWGIADAGVYLDSAHGDATGGVHRSALGYPIGFCDHCHEQHASIGGEEPVPDDGAPSEYLLFFENFSLYIDTPVQADNFCFQCHTGAGSLQDAGYIINLTYSYRAGRWVDSVTSILQVFSSPSPGTSHNLSNISDFIDDNWQGWGYSDSSNPCNACHNPHAAQGDPQGNGLGTYGPKTSASRGWPVSRPSQHSADNNAWGLWGDAAGEKMSGYISTNGGTYQAPYEHNASSGSPTYEPDGSGTINGSNLTDYVTICIDCHNASNPIYSNTLNRYLKTFDWAAEKHGGKDADDDFHDATYAACNKNDYTCPGNPGPCGDCTCNCPDGLDDIDDLISPYAETTLNYVLACTDCHEPHGSPNRFLIRAGVNGGDDITDVTILTSPDNTKQWMSLCGKCHDTESSSIKFIHHVAHEEAFGEDGAYGGAFYNYTCNYCHTPLPSNHRNCLKCHYHGSFEWSNWPGGALGDYDYTEKMF